MNTQKLEKLVTKQEVALRFMWLFEIFGKRNQQDMV